MAIGRCACRIQDEFPRVIANLCELVGADIKEVARGMGYDSRIGDKFLNAGIGYGGSCFPKDTKALDYLATLHGYNIRTVKAAIMSIMIKRSSYIRRLVRDLSLLMV
jgi:UDP-glucose 6-dehydrogenase